LATPSKEARERAELKFRKKEVEAREATKAMADYKAGLVAQREKTARLKALREAKEAADAAARAAQATAEAEAREAAEANANKANKIDAGKAPDPVKRSTRKQVLAAERAG
jgi:hypothetical protein